MASAAVNALRLHQRIPRISFSAQTLQNVLAEDSGHYLAFSLMFLSARQRLIKMENIFSLDISLTFSASMVIMPLIAFALMHSCSYIAKLFNETNCKQISFVQNAVNYIRSKNTSLLQV